jgi:nicotinate dehydrogenase subunit B
VSSSPSPLPQHIEANPRLSQWVTPGSDGVVGVRVGKVELGQGILTALAQVAAEELDVPLSAIRMLPAHTGLGPDQNLTAGSMSVVDAVPAVRLVAAHLRELFKEAAAGTWGVPASELRVGGGAVCTSDGSRQATYAELAEQVDCDVAVRGDVPTRPAGTGGLVGTSVQRIDLPAKIAGKPSYISDLRLPGQRFGRVLRPPSPGARLVSVDDSAVAGATVRLVRDGSFVGVVAATENEAATALERLRKACTWHETDTLPGSDAVDAYLRAGPHEDVVVLDEEPAEPGSQTLRATYSRPFLAHASIAPSCGIARWEDDGRLSVWSHSQGIHRLRAAIAQALALDASAVTVEHVENAGCYGHNPADDAAFDAVLLARAVPGTAVQVRWSRADELSWAAFGSAMTADLEATLDGSGRVRSWSSDVYSQGHTGRPGYAGVPGLLAGLHLEPPLTYPAAADPPTRAGGGSVRNAVPIYDVGARRITGHRLTRTPVRSTALRALGAYLNVFAIESFLDEVALHVGRDPLELRLQHLSDARGRRVLETAAAAAGWGRPTPEGRGRGIGFARYKERGAYCAVVAEVEAGHDIRVERLTIAVDVGRVVNPDGVRNQAEGGAIQSTSWTLKERVRFDRRRITSDDWESYPILRFTEVPRVEVHIVEEGDHPSAGAGEAVQGPTAAAIGNAVAAALGVRVRHLPLTTEAVVAAIEDTD